MDQHQDAAQQYYNNYVGVENRPPDILGPDLVNSANNHYLSKFSCQQALANLDLKYEYQDYAYFYNMWAVKSSFF